MRLTNILASMATFTAAHAVVIARTEAADATHAVTLINNCNKEVTPSFIPAQADVETLASGGGSTTVYMPGDWEDGRVWGLTDVCTDTANGEGCTLVECSLGDSVADSTCNLSAVSGWSGTITLDIGSDNKVCDGPTASVCYFGVDGNLCAALAEGGTCEAYPAAGTGGTAPLTITFSDCS